MPFTISIHAYKAGHISLQSTELCRDSYYETVHFIEICCNNAHASQRPDDMTKIALADTSRIGKKGFIYYQVQSHFIVECLQRSMAVTFVFLFDCFERKIVYFLNSSSRAPGSRRFSFEVEENFKVSIKLEQIFLANGKVVIKAEFYVLQ